MNKKAFYGRHAGLYSLRPRLDKKTHSIGVLLRRNKFVRALPTPPISKNKSENNNLFEELCPDVKRNSSGGCLRKLDHHPE
jgi:hypothetical protein